MITPKGIVNCGDSFRNRSCNSSQHSLVSYNSDMCVDVFHGSTGSLCSQGPAKYRVGLLGAPAVGKTTLAQQFLTSECIVEKDSIDSKFNIGCTFII